MYSRRGGTKLSYRADDSSWRDTHPYTACLTFSSYARHTPLSRISHLKQMWDTTLWVCPSSVKSETHVIEVCLQFGVGALNISGPHALSQHLANFQNTHPRSCPILDVDPGACCHLDLGPGACHRLNPSPKHAAASTPALQHIVISNLIDSLELNLNSNNFFSDSIAAPTHLPHKTLQQGTDAPLPYICCLGWLIGKLVKICSWLIDSLYGIIRLNVEFD
jgi:hypothetical protein